MSRAAAPLEVPDMHRRALEDIARSRALPAQEVRRARALLLAADGVSNVDIARLCGVTPRTVSQWRERFRHTGVDAVRWDRRGRTPAAGIPADFVPRLAAAPVTVIGLYVSASQRILAATTRGEPRPGTHDDMVVMDGSSSGHKDPLTFLKAVDHWAGRDAKVLVVLDRWSQPMDRYDVGRWLAHPRRKRFQLRLAPTAEVWQRLAAAWLERTDRCAAVAPPDSR
jgi:hypothetical protein